MTMNWLAQVSDLVRDFRNPYDPSDPRGWGLEEDEILKRLSDQDIALLDPWLFDRALLMLSDEARSAVGPLELHSLVQFAEALLLHDIVIVPADYVASEALQTRFYRGEVRAVLPALSNIVFEGDLTSLLDASRQRRPLREQHRERVDAALGRLDVLAMLLRERPRATEYGDFSFPYLAAESLGESPVIALQPVDVVQLLLQARMLVSQLHTHLQVAEITNATFYPSPLTRRLAEIFAVGESGAVAARIHRQFESVVDAAVSQADTFLGIRDDELRLPYWVAAALDGSARPSGVLSSLLELRGSNAIVNLRRLATHLRRSSRELRPRLIKELKREMEDAINGQPFRGILVPKIMSLLPAVFTLDISKLLSEASTLVEVTRGLKARVGANIFFSKALGRRPFSSVLCELSTVYRGRLDESITRYEDIVAYPEQLAPAPPVPIQTIAAAISELRSRIGPDPL